MITVDQAKTKSDQQAVRALFGEYLRWANREVKVHFGVSFDIKEVLEDDMGKLDIFSPPRGRLLLARSHGQIAGLACLKQIRVDVGEVKRMYVRPDFRGQGIGRVILENIIAEARTIGYTELYLDSARFMTAAHALYRSKGFQEITPYPESEIPVEYQANWLFMKLKL